MVADTYVVRKDSDANAKLLVEVHLSTGIKKSGRSSPLAHFLALLSLSRKSASALLSCTFHRYITVVLYSTVHPVADVKRKGKAKQRKKRKEKKRKKEEKEEKEKRKKEKERREKRKKEETLFASTRVRTVDLLALKRPYYQSR